MAPKPKPIPKRFLKILKGKGRKKGEGLTLTEGLTEGEGLAQTDPNISLKKQKPVKLKLKTTFASHGSKALYKGSKKQYDFPTEIPPFNPIDPGPQLPVPAVAALIAFGGTANYAAKLIKDNFKKIKKTKRARRNKVGERTYGSKNYANTKPKGVGVALKGYGRAMK